MRRYCCYLLGCFLVAVCVCRLFFPVQKKEEWECSFHQLIELYQLIDPHPMYTIQCHGAFAEADQPSAYSVELQLVTMVYGRGASVVPPLSGYLSNPFEIIEIAQGDVRCDVQSYQTCILKDRQAVSWNTKAGAVALEKSHDHFRIINKAASGTTYVQEFELPEGETFATNLGEQYVLPSGSYKVVLPHFLSWFQSYMPVDSRPLQMERFLVVRYGTVDESER